MLAGMSARAIAADLFETAPELRLIAGRHRETGRVVFPLPADSAAFERIGLPDRGVLWSYTVQRFEPKSPPYHATGPFEPFAVGYVELAGTLIVESRLTGVRFDELRVGLPMQITTIPLRTDADGGVILMFAFRPQSTSPQ
jgi:uncharacterized protein